MALFEGIGNRLFKNTPTKHILKIKFTIKMNIIMNTVHVPLCVDLLVILLFEKRPN